MAMLNQSISSINIEIDYLLFLSHLVSTQKARIYTGNKTYGRNKSYIVSGLSMCSHVSLLLKLLFHMVLVLKHYQ